jgi:uncharacterized metal-binding protein YceD (DUF177 family)
MIKVFIQGLNDGEYQVDITLPVESVKDISSEYFGDLKVIGKMLIHHRRYAMDLRVICKARLICDMSLNEFVEKIEFDYKNSFIANQLVFADQKKRDLKPDEEKAIAEDEKFIDLTDDIREELIVHLPMKRVSPEFRDKSFEDVFPQYSGSDNKKSKKKKDHEIDDRWSALKNIKLN